MTKFKNKFSSDRQSNICTHTVNSPETAFSLNIKTDKVFSSAPEKFGNVMLHLLFS